MDRTIAEYANRYAGRRFVIVGKGPTRYDYPDLAKIHDPIIFINDAVQFAPLAANSRQRFWFAVDELQAYWLTHPAMSNVTPVLPRAPEPDTGVTRGQQRLFVSSCPAAQDHQRTVTYEWGGRALDITTQTRKTLIKDGRLPLRGGTIHPAIAFAWLCGASEIAFIGCDGAGEGYDDRIQIESQTPNLNVHKMIRKRQDELLRVLDIDATYVGDSLPPVISRLATFVWIGERPDWLTGILAAFREHNPKWHTRLITNPPTMWDGLNKAVEGCRQICQIADIIYCWELWQRGGIVMDIDSVTVRSFEPLRKAVPAWTTQHHGGSSRPTNGVMGSVPGSDAFRRCLEYIEMRHLRNARDDGWARCQYGPDMLREVFTDQGDEDLRMLPWHYFYPFPYPERGAAIDFWISDETRRTAMLDSISERFTDSERPYAVHMWGVDGSSKREVQSACASR